MKKQEEIRKQVSEDYARAVKQPVKGKGCCCGADEAQKGAVARLAGYGTGDLEGLPADAVVNSFGCGNPVAFAEVKAGQTVLDLGSGAGIDILIAARKVGPTGRVIGIDMTDEMIEKARANISASGLEHIEVRKGIIEEMPVEDASVDWIISNCVINLSPQKPRVFAEMARVLRPGGRILVSDIVVRDLPDWVRDSRDLYTSCIAGAISEDEYVAGLEAAGLEDVEVRDRLVYEASQLRDFIQVDIAGGDTRVAAWLERAGASSIEELAASIEGKVWSAMFHARKAAA